MLDLQTANLDELKTISGIGESSAKKILNVQDSMQINLATLTSITHFPVSKIQEAIEKGLVKPLTLVELEAIQGKSATAKSSEHLETRITEDNKWFEKLLK